jgi:putative Mn2+ efflux pump MntP
MAALLLLALALAADAFAVSLVRGAAGPHSVVRALECGAAFGVAQGLMAALGWLLGELFAVWIQTIDHWIAFVLLALLGGRMIRAAFADEEEDVPEEGPDWSSHLWSLLAAALATSVDAAAGGLTLELFEAPVWLSCLVIGGVTALVCVVGYWFASRLGARLGRVAEAVGGVVLIALGVKILVDHIGGSASAP